MTSYRRHFVPGGSYFFTVDLPDRRLRLLTDQIEVLRTVSIYANSTSVHGRRYCRVTGPPAHHLDFPQGGVGFCAPLAAHQSELLAKPAATGASIT
jgi:hypothetical protein